ncbi:hypothetical protein Lal_00043169 [Lupinus albus]|nr:hypothetical protein Lal_00043169 [Lupinus albus]
MEQQLNNRMDLHFQGLKDSYFAGMEQYEERQTAYSDNQFQELRNLIQSIAEAQNALFCSQFQKLSVLIRGDQNIVVSTLIWCRIAKRLSVSSLSVRLRDKERTEVLGWGYAERKVFFVGRKGVKP